MRTGYDSVIAHRTSSMFAFTARKPGTVRSVEAKGIIVDYDDETVQGYELGRRYGNAAGLTVAHNIVSSLRVGDKVAVGDVVCYNDGFFEPDFFNPKEVVWKNATNVKTVLWESAQTLEDASLISKRVGDKLSTKITKVKNIVLTFDQSISRLVKVGSAVEADTILCIIEDAITADNKLFDEQSLDTLRALSAQTPRAHVKGVVEKIEVFYHGDKDDMSEPLKALASSSDKELKQFAQATARTVYTGSVDGGFRIEGNPLVLDSLAVRIYITSTVGAGLGDKGAFCNQLKTVFSEVMDDDLISENGDIIDAAFGGTSIAARIVNSPDIIGTTNTLLKVITKKALALYRS